MNIFYLFLKTSLLVKFVICILIIVSIVSWAIIFQKVNILNIAAREAKMFENKFWSSLELSFLYQESQKCRDNLFGIEHIFYSGFKEFTCLYQTNRHAPEAIIKGASRAMRISMNHELEMLETHIPSLYIIGYISPYIGLFGTTLGIMHSFISLSTAKQVTLQMISPSIAEALITTAIGLFAAIPAIIAYNCLNQSVSKLELSYGNFMEEFAAILHRQIFTPVLKESNTSTKS